MNPAYFATHFEPQEAADDWPAEFAILTAYATTGETWPAAENRAADLKLEAELRREGRWLRRLTGYSPETGHSEPGWAVAMGLDEACDVGMRYRQDALYYVLGDGLFVSFCDARRALRAVGVFRSRLHPAGG